MTIERDARTGTEITELEPEEYVAAIPELAALLVDAVEGGASVNFLAGVTEPEARAWWTARIPEVADGTTTVLVARSAVDGRPGAGSIVGSTLLVRTRNPNAPHRAEIGKVIVHRSLRRRGLGRALMEAAEARALAGTAADALYRSMGWQELGTMPNHAYSAAGVLSPTTYFWKDLRR